MMRALSIAATGMTAQELKMNVTANNLANANTTGFKKARAEFEDLLAEQISGAEAPRAEGGARPSPLEFGLGVRVASTTRSFAQGDMINTQNPLDIAIEGRGFLAVRLPTGDLAYTRAGSLRIDADGRLVTQQGMTLDPPITVPDGTTDVEITNDGRVHAKVSGSEKLVDIGQIEMTTFPNPGGLESLGDTMLRATEAAGQPTTSTPGNDGAGGIAQGFLEGANVSTVEEMIDLITTQRAYEMSSKVIQTADQMLQRLSNLK